jgi:hypothetical protein
MRLTLLAFLLLTLTVTLAGGANAPNPSNRAAAPLAAGDHTAGWFSSAERNLIRAWLLETQRRTVGRRPASGLPPELDQTVAHGQALPPDRQQKLVRGERLGHDDYRRGRMLPDDLLRQLPPAPPGSEILQIEDQVLRLDAATRTILDIFALGGGD